MDQFTDEQNRLNSEQEAMLEHLRVPPQNIIAEQSVLGAILINNQTYHRVSEYLRPEDFFEPVHQRIYKIISDRIESGQLADPKSLYHLFDQDEALSSLDRAQYLSRLGSAAETIINAVEYARIIRDLAMKRELIALGEEVVNKAFDPQLTEPAQTQIEDAEQSLFNLAVTGHRQGGFREFDSIMTSTVQHIERAYKKAGKITGVPTGLDGLDQKLAGMQPSDLIILAARPSMGKSALAMTIAVNAAATVAAEHDAKKLKTKNYAVGVFSLEMSAEQIGTRLLSSQSKIESDLLRRGELNDEHWPALVGAAQELAALPIFIDDTPALTIAGLRSRARRLMRSHGLSMIVVDYLQLMHGSSSSSSYNRVQEISEITQGLKAIAKELDVPVIALSQLNRSVENREDKRPQMSDLRDSGSIEQDADVVLFIYREDYYLKRAEPQQKEGESMEAFQRRTIEFVERCTKAQNMADIIVAKQRNGPIGTVKLQFDPEFGRFYNLEIGRYDDD